MPLQLVIGVDVEGNAKRELAAIEQGIRKVESAAKSTADPVTKVTQAITGQNAAIKHTTDDLMEETKAWMAKNKALGEARAGVDAAAKAHMSLSTSVAAATTATGLSATALTVLTGGLALAAAGTVAFAAVLVKSTRHYFEHAEATRDSRKALDDLTKGWDAFQMTVGRAVLGDNFSIVKPIQLFNAGLQVAGGYIAVAIDRTKEWLDVLIELNKWLPPWMRSDALNAAGRTGDLLTGPMPVAPHTQSGAGLLMWRNRVQQGMEWESTPAYQAQRQWDEFAKELEKSRKEAEKAAAAWAKFLREELPRVIPGITFTLPSYTEVGLPAWAATGIAPRAGLMRMPVTPWLANPFETPASIPELWGQIFNPYSISTSPFDVRPQPAGPGFWGQGGAFQQGMANIAYGGGPSWLGRSAAAGQQIRAGLDQGGFSGYSSAAMGAVQGGMAIWDATSGGGGAGKLALKGAASGAMAGTMIMPGIGTAIGAGIGALVGAVRGWLAPTEYELREKARHEQLNAVQAGIAGMGGHDYLARQWGVLGMQGSYDEQVKNMWDPKVALGFLKEMEDRTVRLQAAMEKYGITWEQLGEKAKQSKIDALAKTLIEDFEVLYSAGADTTLIIEKMGGAVNEFVQAALRTGSEVPAAMKPMIQKMIEMGLLTDEGGSAFKDLESTGIVFAKTMTQGFDQISAAIDRLAIALGYVPEKLDDISTAASRAADQMGRLPGERPPDREGEPPRPPEAHTGGFITAYGVLPSFHRGGDVLARLQPGEFVMQKSAVQRYGLGAMRAINSGRAGGGPTVIHNVIQINRRTLFEEMAEVYFNG